jgi:DNA-binding response OmpR family regulator
LGSEFTVRLPIGKVPVEAAQKPSDGERVMPRGARQRRILVVDDNRDVADGLVLMPRIAATKPPRPTTAWRQPRRRRYSGPTRRLDISLPRMNGFEAARHIREQPWGKGMALIALTGWRQEEDKRRALEAGFDHH